MQNMPSTSHHVVGDNAPMAPPPQALRAHDHASLRSSYFAQPFDSTNEFSRIGIVGI
jgi:hypothetical protein